MKKILPIILVTALCLAACGKKKGLELVDNSAAVAETTETTEAESTSSESEEETADPSDNGRLAIVAIDGEKYFDFTAEDFIKKLNAQNKEIMNDPQTYEESAQKAGKNERVYESAKGVLCVLEIEPKSKKIAGIAMMAAQTEDFKLTNLAIEASPVLMLLDNTIEAQYGAKHLVDIAVAGQLTSYSSSQYVYEGVHEGIQERIYAQDNLTVFHFSPAEEVPEEIAPVASTNVNKPDFGPLSEDLYSFQLQVNEDVYQLPMTYEQLTAFGWVYQGDETETLTANAYRLTDVFKRGEETCYVGITNFDVNTLPLRECYVTAIRFSQDMLKNTQTTITLPGQITIGGSMDDAVALYGTPTNEYSRDTSRSVTYSMSTYQEVKLTAVYGETQTIGEISVRNMAEPKDFVAGAISDEVPAIVSKYQAPSQLSDSFGDYIMEYGGDLYQLPAPVSKFVENGWTINDEASEETIAGKDSSWVTLMKDNQKLKVLAKNYDENATAMLNGFITDLVSDVYTSKTAITIAKNITVGMSRQDLEGALTGTEYETEDSGSFVYYKIQPGENSSCYYSISISKENDSVSQIKVQNGVKYADYVNR